MLAEIAGKEVGYCRVRVSMHIADRQLGHLGANAIAWNSSCRWCWVKLPTSKSPRGFYCFW